MKISSHDARSSLSPRAGRGRGEGASTLLARCKSSPDRQDTPYQLRIAERPPQPILLPARGEKEPRAARGERWGERSRSRDACAPEACRPKLRILIASKKKKGGGAPVGATVSWGLATQRMLPSVCASGAAARSAERARLSALHRGARLGHVPKLDPGRASRDAVRRRYLCLGIALKRSTSRAGRNAGGVDARTAREQK
jgi:hypothetical protein